ncbi:hypothetical protein SteCoe_34982 [Stentor coeruleus]|uniref:Uncharacterized protein n=1 Tax=Stentor coeruleus TaxID=5963 RepID=A0A1R2ATI1_9CILI|nr:hypothetical protein SteCoe_34982 [Stentor coeruleus]
MVYIIRHKGFWEYAAGRGYFDQTFHSFIKFIDPPKSQTMFITKKNCFYFPFRYLHLYRTLKRAGNQFFQGNEFFQNTFTLVLRAMYERIPEQAIQRPGGWEMLVHKGERHWEIMTYNQHPLQHDFYELANMFCHDSQGEKTQEEETRLNEFMEKVKNLCEEKRSKLGLDKHETLHINDIQDAFDQEMKHVRAEKGSAFYVRPQDEIEDEINKENPRRVSYFY